MTTKVATLAARTAKRATQRATRGAMVTSCGVELSHLKTHITWLQGQIEDVDANVASMTHDYVELGETSDWRDARLPQLDETIRYWTNRRDALSAQLRDARTRRASLMARSTTLAATAATVVASQAQATRDIYAGQRGAQPMIVREAW